MHAKVDLKFSSCYVSRLGQLLEVQIQRLRLLKESLAGEARLIIPDFMLREVLSSGGGRRDPPRPKMGQAGLLSLLCPAEPSCH